MAHGCSKSAAVAHIFFVNEDVDVLAYVALLGDDAVPQAGIFLPQTREHFPQGAAVRIDLDINLYLAPAIGVLPERSWNVENDGH